jgi:hypothetical protein
MTDVNEDTTTLAILATKMDHMAKDMSDIKSSLATSTTVHVTRAEWELRNQNTDERFVNAAADRKNLWDEFRRLEARRAPWWTILAAIGSAVAIGALLLQWVPNIVN